MVESIVTAPGALPVLGHALSLLRSPLAFLQSLPRHGDLVGVRIGPVHAVVVCDPTLTRDVLRNDRIFDKGGPQFDRAREVLGDGLATCPHSRHRRQRRLVQPAFHHSRQAAYAQAAAMWADTVTGSWQDGQILDVVHEMQTMSAGTTVRALFSGSLPPAALNDALDDLTTVLDGMYRRMLLPSALARLPDRAYSRARARLLRFVRQVIDDSAGDNGDLLSALLATRENDGTGLSDDEIVDQVVTFFTGGGGTAAATLSWTLYELARHPEILAKVRAEADAVLGGRIAQHDDVPRLELTQRVVNESLRMWPPAWIVNRKTTAPVTLGPYELPEGLTVVYSPYIVQHRPDLHADPDRFDPDRWLPERVTSMSRDAYIPFGGGARKCVGDQVGLQEAVIFLSAIVARWDLTLVPGQRVRPGIGTFMMPRGLRMRATTGGAR